MDEIRMQAGMAAVLSSWSALREQSELESEMLRKPTSHYKY
jgi:hypothetical protein